MMTVPELIRTVTPFASADTRAMLTSLRPSLRRTLLASPRTKFTGMLFFCSGISALIYQVAWQRVLTQAIGVDAISIAVIVTIFMLGLGFGALAGGWLSFRFRRHIPAVYAAIELSIGAFGLVSIPLLKSVNGAASALGYQSVTFDFAVNAAVLLPPTLLMGATTPLIVEYVKSQFADYGKTVGLFYGVNVLGAAAGSVLTLFLIELLGLRGTIAVAVALNVAIGTVFLFAAPRWPQARADDQDSGAPLQAETAADMPPTFGADLRLASFLFGFVNLSMEMILLRILFFYFTPASFVFPLLLCAYLLAMAAGQFGGGAWIDACPPARKVPFLFQLLIAGCLMLLIILSVPLRLFDLIFVNTLTAQQSILGMPIALAIALFMMLPAVAFSAYLPAMCKIASSDVKFAGDTFGGVLFWSTLGNIAGTFCTAIVLFEYVGTIPAALLVAGLTLAGVLLVARRRMETRSDLLKWAWIGAASVALLALLVPKDFYYQALGSARPIMGIANTTRPVAVLEGRTSVTPVYFNEKSRRRMEIRPFNAPAAAAYISDRFVYYQFYSLAVPQMLDPNFRPRRVLMIGLGSGEFPFVMKELPSVARFVIVELSPEVLAAYERYSAPLIADTLRHPKVEVHAMDGRRYVQQASAAGEKFDLVQIGILGLTQAGASNIYSLDFFKQVRSLLTPDGYLALAPYLGVVRLGFELYPHGYAGPGSSWVFMHNNQLALADGQRLAVPEQLMRLYQAKSFEDLRTRLPPAEPGSDHDTELAITEYDRQDMVRLFPDMVGTDDNLIFEYFHLSQLFPGYTSPSAVLTAVEILKPRTVHLTIHREG